MAYKRRYLSGQEAATVDIAEDAITPDKISPGAVGPEALAPDSVTGEKILPGTIETSDLKDELITSPKISPGAVDTEALAAKCVTQEKLSDEILPSVRPFSPGIATEEIADDAVDHDKIKPEAVESDSIKPGAVNTAAVAHDAITDDKIADDAVQAEHVENGAIVAGKCANDSISETCIIDGSCAHDKIGVGAVAGDRVADHGIDLGKLDYNSVLEENLAVNALAARHLEAYRVGYIDFSEDFRGVDVCNRWRKQLTYDGYIINTEEGVKLVSPSAAAGWPVLMDYGGNGIVGYGGKLLLTFLLAGSDEPITLQGRQLGLKRVSDEDAWIMFYQDENNPNTNWYATTREAGSTNMVDTGIGLVAGPQILGIEWNSPTNVRFYIDGIQVAEITTHIPNDSILDPYVWLCMHTAAIRDFTLGAMSLQRIRETP